MASMTPVQKFGAKYTPMILLALAASAAVMLTRHVLDRLDGTDPQGMVREVADSARQAVIRVDTVLVTQQARTDTITRLVTGAPGLAVAAAERRASEALAVAQATETNTVHLRLTYDAALARKDSVIADQAVIIDSVGVLAARMTQAHAKARADLAAAKANLNTVAIAPKAQQGCGVYCTTGKVVIWGGTAYVGAKYVQKYGVGLPH